MGACLFAMCNGFMKTLMMQGVSKWAIFVVRGNVSIILNWMMVYLRLGRTGVVRCTLGMSEPTTDPQQQKSNRSLPGITIYVRGCLGAVGATVLIITYDRFMTFADAFAIFLGLVTVFSNVLAVVVLKEHVRHTTVVGGVLCIVGIVLVVRPPFLFGPSASNISSETGGDHFSASGGRNTGVAPHSAVTVLIISNTTHDSGVLSHKNASTSPSLLTSGSINAHPIAPLATPTPYPLLTISTTMPSASLGSRRSLPDSYSHVDVPQQLSTLPTLPTLSSPSESLSMPGTPTLLGLTMLILASLCSAGAQMLSRALSGRAPHTLLHGYMSVLAVEGVAAMVMLRLPAVFPHTLEQWVICAMYIGLSQGGQLLMAQGFQRETLSVGSVLTNMEMAFAFAVDAVMLHEDITLPSLGGAGLIFIGGSIVAFGSRLRTASEEDTEGGRSQASCEGKTSPRSCWSSSSELDIRGDNLEARDAVCLDGSESMRYAAPSTQYLENGVYGEDDQGGDSSREALLPPVTSDGRDNW